MTRLPNSRTDSTETKPLFRQSSYADANVRSSVSKAISKSVCRGELTTPPEIGWNRSRSRKFVRRIRTPLIRGVRSEWVDSSSLPRGILLIPQNSAAVLPEAHEFGTAQHAAAISAPMSRGASPSAKTVPLWIGRITPSAISLWRAEPPIPSRLKSSRSNRPFLPSAAAIRFAIRLDMPPMWERQPSKSTHSVAQIHPG